MNKQKNLIWYAVYGSNLSQDRFMHYINGGQPPGGNREYKACIDLTPPRKVIQFEINYDLVFAKNSSAWQNGGVAFIDNIQNSDARTLSKLYLITQEQFNHIAQHETNSASAVLIDFEQAINNGQTVFKRPSWYGLVLYLGQFEDYPILTLTSEERLNSFTKPGPQYLSQIVAGLMETYFFTIDEVYHYLRSKKGILDNYRNHELYDVVAGLNDPTRDTTRKLFSDYAREYENMPEGTEKEKLKVLIEQLVQRYYGGINLDYLS